MKTLFKFLLIFTAILTSVSCNNKDLLRESYLRAELPVIERTIHNSIGWAKEKDFNMLYRVISNDSDYLEVSPGPRITKGFINFKKNEEFWSSPDFKAIRYEIRDLKITVSGKGDVAWYYCILDDINEWKGKPANWESTRWTGVLEKRKEKWVIVQMHFSFAKV